MHNLLKKVTLWGLASIMAVGMVAYPKTARPVVAKGGYANSTQNIVAASSDAAGMIGKKLSIPTLPSTPAGATSFVAKNTVWKYFAKQKSPNENWINASFSDGSWLKGRAPLGYGNGRGNQATKVTFGGKQNNRFITTYFRKAFSIKDPSQITSLTMQLLHDDGAYVWLNGTMIAHPNMSSSRPGYDTLASTCSTADINTIVDIPTSLLHSGKNVLAVEVHQCAKDSKNMVFNASLYGQGPQRQPTAAPTQRPTVAPTTPPSSGGLPAAPNGQKWALRWGDEFSGSSVDTGKWKINNLTRPEDPNKTWYIPRNVAVSNGTLKLTVKQESYNGANYTGGMLESNGSSRRNLYGYYEARIKYNFVGPGFWANFWICGVDRWPPEIDNEIVTHHPGAVYQANHFRDSAGTHKSDHQYYTLDYNQWHTYGVLWLPGKPIQFFVDGKPTYSPTSGYESPPTIDMYVSLRAGAYNAADWGGIPNSSTRFPGQAEYDYVHVYQAVNQ